MALPIPASRARVTTVTWAAIRFIGPDYRNFDLALSKLTTITERFKLLFRVDAYNLTNHPNFANPLAVAFFADAAPNRSGAFPTGINPVDRPKRRQPRDNCDV